MRRSVRLSITALSVMFLLFAMQIGVAAKKKTSKRKARTARSTVVVGPLVFTHQAAEEVVSNHRSVGLDLAPTVPVGNDLRGEGGPVSLGGNGSEAQKADDFELPAAPTAGSLVISEFRVRGPSGAND